MHNPRLLVSHTDPAEAPPQRRVATIPFSVIHGFFRFATVGLVATAVHYAVLIGLVRVAGTAAIAASAAGFVTGGLVGYTLNRRFTFVSRRGHHMAIPLFFLVAGSGLVINTALMAVLIRHFGVHYLFAQAMVTATLLVYHFLLHRYITFAEPARTR